MTIETPQDAPQTPVEADPVLDSQDAPEGPQDGTQDALGDAETFPRAYVEQLRQENGRQRQKAQKADEYAQQVHTLRVAATGRLQDATDLAFDETHLDSEEALTAAIDALLQVKPHLASGRPRGDVGQGVSGAAGSVNLAGMLRARA